MQFVPANISVAASHQRKESELPPHGVLLLSSCHTRAGRPEAHLGRWVIVVVVGLIVLIPLIACVHAIEVLGPPGAVLLMPPVRLGTTATAFS